VTPRLARCVAGWAVIVGLAGSLALGGPAPAAAAPTRPPGAKRAPAAHGRTQPPPASPGTRPGPSVPRRLDDIRIEGEIPVPQVLFITAREQRRFMEFQHHRYQRTCVELGRATATPSQIVVTTPAPAERKEQQR